MRPQSLRSRLILIILGPLLLIAVIAGGWQFRNATDRAAEIFDRGLLSAALAISRDIALSGGDALSPETRTLISDTSGGELFYHVFAPDGVFVTGYATPPVMPASLGKSIKAAQDSGPATPIYYDARYQGNDVRVMRFQDVTRIDGLSGAFHITVWQKMAVRSSFVREVVTRSFAVIALLVASVAFVVWFGVGIGLRPLLDLEQAIARRTPTELQPIRRQVPIETRGIVATLNALLDRVSRRISSKDEFISNAAHQLRNPVAGVLALAEAVHGAPDDKAMRARSGELLDAARGASRLTDQLLSFERASGVDMANRRTPVDIDAVIRACIARFQTRDRDRDQAAEIEISYDTTAPDAILSGDAVMMQESLLNLLTNAITHGGPGLSRIAITLHQDGGNLILRVCDDGHGIDPDKRLDAMARFGQAGESPGNGLGLPIAARVMERHGGSLHILPNAGGARIEIRLPRAQSGSN